MNRIAKVILARWQLLLFLVLLYGLYSFFVEIFGKSPAINRSVGCANNVKQIGKDIASYRTKHNGAMPQTLQDAVSARDARYLLLCPNNPKDEGRSSYAYKYTDKPQTDDVICWDAKPEFWSNHFTGKDYPPIRNILRNSGKVQRVSEEDFQKLNLQGVAEPIKP